MRGQGTIYHRGDSLWISWYGGGDRREAVSTLCGKDALRTTWDDAVKVLKRRLDEKTAARMAGSILPAKQKPLTMAQVIDGYAAHKLAAGVKRPGEYRQMVKALKAWWGHLPAMHLTKEIVDVEITKKREAGFQPGTIKNRVANLYAALRLSRDRLPYLPAQPKITVLHTRNGRWTEEELEVFCSVAKPWIADVARFLSWTGWRISEVLGLTWDRVDLKRRLLYLDDTKTDDPRLRHITEPALLEILNRRRDARRLGCRFVFHLDGLQISDSRFRYRWHQALFASNLKGKFPHDFRRTAYDNMLIATNGDLLTAMESIGHKSLSAARRYTRPNIERQRQALERVVEYRTRTSAAHRTPVKGSKSH